MKSNYKIKFIQLFLVLTFTLFLTQCGSDSDDVEIICVLSSLTGGDYSFRLVDIGGTCAGVSLLPIPEDTYSITLPAYDKLPAETTFQLPIIGEVTARFTADGNSVQVVTVPAEISGTVSEPGITGTFKAVVTGVLCPTSTNTAVMDLSVDFKEINLVIFTIPYTTPCIMDIDLIGAL